MPKFKQLLIRLAVSVLREQGYKFDPNSQGGDITYTFHKTLEDQSKGVILFQRQQLRERPVGYGFTIELIRGKTTDFVHWEEYENALNLRLGQVLWYVY